MPMNVASMDGIVVSVTPMQSRQAVGPAAHPNQNAANAGCRNNNLDNILAQAARLPLLGINPRV